MRATERSAEVDDLGTAGTLSGGGTESVALEALLEVRAMLRAIAPVRDPLIVTNAREQARNGIAALRSNK